MREPVGGIDDGDGTLEFVVNGLRPASEPVFGEFGVEFVVDDFFVGAVGVFDLNGPVKAFGRVAADGVVERLDGVAFRICRF
ncbi:MAG TPA: hypothetical protein VIT91_21010 [Chthoniobacterales bacterium]